MAFSNNSLPGVDQNISDITVAGEMDLCTINVIDALSSHPSDYDEDVSGCSFFLMCLSRCLKSRPKINDRQLPNNLSESKSIAVKWLEEHPNSLEPSEQDALPQEMATGESAQEIYHLPSPDKKLPWEFNLHTDLTCALDVKVAADLPEKAKGRILVSSVNSENTPAICPEDSKLNAVPLQQSLNNEIEKSISPCGNCMPFAVERINVSSTSSEKQLHDQASFSKCNVSCSSKGTNTNVVLEDVSPQNIFKDEVCKKSSLEKWRESIERAPREYFEIDANLVAGRDDLHLSKGRTFHVTIDRDKKFYDRPRENVIYKNGLICVQSGAPIISETQANDNDKDISLASADINPAFYEGKC